MCFGKKAAPPDDTPAVRTAGGASTRVAEDSVIRQDVNTLAAAIQQHIDNHFDLPANSPQRVAKLREYSQGICPVLSMPVANHASMSPNL